MKAIKGRPRMRWLARSAPLSAPCSASGARTACKPHRLRQFKLSTDPLFAAKLREIVSPWLNPPAHAIVLSVDEKSGVQALDRTQPGLPLKRGRCGTMTHDYVRNRTTTLFAALDVLQGRVIGRCMQRHRHQEFIRFLNAIKREVPAGKLIHVILDNYAAHKHPKVTAWLARHPRVALHFTPTSASWLNAVEGFFAKLAKHRLKRGVFNSLVSLQAAINRYLDQANDNPHPFRWTKEPDKIIAAVGRGHQVLDSIQPLSCPEYSRLLYGSPTRCTWQAAENRRDQARIHGLSPGLRVFDRASAEGRAVLARRGCRRAECRASRPRQQPGQTDEVVGGHGEGELPVDLRQFAMAGFAQAGNGLGQPKASSVRLRMRRLIA
jgi:transposase